jgi:toxin CptA
MSIAVSVVIKPSRLAFAMVGAICIASALIGLIIGLGSIGNIGFPSRVALAIVCICAGIRGVYYATRMGKEHHIDISGIGQIRLVETTAVADPAFCNNAPGSANAGEVVSLMDDSTLWPFLLLLRLQAEDKRTRTVLVLPDSVDRAGFRALSVACRWVVAHSGASDSGGQSIS